MLRLAAPHFRTGGGQIYHRSSILLFPISSSSTAPLRPYLSYHTTWALLSSPAVGPDLETFPAGVGREGTEGRLGRWGLYQSNRRPFVPPAALCIVYLVVALTNDLGGKE